MSHAVAGSIPAAPSLAIHQALVQIVDVVLSQGDGGHGPHDGGGDGGS